MMKAEYINHMGDDLTVVNAARVSFDKESEWEPAEGDDFMIAGAILSERDTKLVKYLARHGHWTPFAHPQITMRETVPIFVARQRFKHMIGFTYSETSRRYVDDAPEFFVPESWRARPDGSVKQGSGSDVDDQNLCKNHYWTATQAARQAYESLLEAGVAPEQARMVLPQSMMTSYYVTGSLAAWARAYNQRIDAHAQREIQDLAKWWGQIIEPLFPTAWKALTER